MNHREVIDKLVTNSQELESGILREFSILCGLIIQTYCLYHGKVKWQNADGLKEAVDR